MTSQAGTTVGVDQMHRKPRSFAWAGQPPDDDWNGSWTIKSKTLRAGSTPIRNDNFGIADIDDTRGDFQELTIGTNDGPNVGGSTSNFSVHAWSRPPSCSESQYPSRACCRATGTLTVIGECQRQFARPSHGTIEPRCSVRRRVHSAYPAMRPDPIWGGGVGCRMTQVWYHPV